MSMISQLVRRLRHYEAFNINQRKLLDEAADTIEMLSEKAKPRTAHWSESDLEFEGAEDFWECSECGWEIYSSKAKTNYCPSCGCRMEHEEETIK